MVTDWAEYSPRYQAVYTERYAAGVEAADAGTAGVGMADAEAAGVGADGVEADGATRWHPHVHGANLGVTAAAYLAAGGFSALRTGEDHALVRALETAGRRRSAHHRRGRGDLGAPRRTSTGRVRTLPHLARTRGHAQHGLTVLQHGLKCSARAKGPRHAQVRGEKAPEHGAVPSTG